MALKGIRVIEMAGLAPAPFCGMILADFGAKVIKVGKLSGAGVDMDRLARGKQYIGVDVKQTKGREVVRRLCRNADVLIEPFRKGVMEKLDLGPEKLLKDNPRLIYARLTGYGQTGALSTVAGHDINYLSISGILSTLGRKGEKPAFPINLLADFAGGGLTCALGIAMALYERTMSGRGQVIDCNMVEGAAYIGSFIMKTRDLPLMWTGERGTNLLDSGAHFYDTYTTKDGKYMGVGAIEPQFYNELLQGLSLSHEDAPQFGSWPELKEKFTEIFATKTQKEWCEIFDGTDACVTPILTLEEAPEHEHNKSRKAFLYNEEGVPEPGPAPRLMRTPGVDEVKPDPMIGEHSVEVLTDLGYTQKEIQELISDNIVEAGSKSKL